jgi:hypothetical protein
MKAGEQVTISRRAAMLGPPCKTAPFSPAPVVKCLVPRFSPFDCG